MLCLYLDLVDVNLLLVVVLLIKNLLDGWMSHLTTLTFLYSAVFTD